MKQTSTRGRALSELRRSNASGSHRDRRNRRQDRRTRKARAIRESLGH